MVFIHGKMGGNMKVSILRIRSMAMVSTYGQMEGNMKDIGGMESKMEKVNTTWRMVHTK